MTEVIEYKKRRREKRKVVALMLSGMMISELTRIKKGRKVK